MSLILAAGLAALTGGMKAGQAPGVPASLVILFTHDLHSNVLPRPVLGAGGTKTEAGGLARLATLIRRERGRAADRTLVLDAGDYSMGTLFHTLYTSESAELRLLGLMGYDVATLGNHEFDFGLDGLAKSLAAAKAKGTALPALVASNVTIEGSGEAAEAGRAAFRDYPVRDYLVLEKAGLRVGLFGLFGQNAADDSPFADPAAFLDPVVHARRAVDLLRTREKVDLVVCLSHTGTMPERTRTWDILLAEKAPGIDVLVSGHTHTRFGEPFRVGRTLIVSSGYYGYDLGRLELVPDGTSGFSVVSYELLPVGPDVPDDPAVFEAGAGFKKLVESQFLSEYPGGFGETLAESAYDFETPEAVEAASVESGLGNLVTDAFREAVRRAEGEAYRHIHVVVEPVGVLRDTILRGPVSIAAAFQILSLGVGYDGRPGYPLLGLYLYGKELKRLLEVQASIVPMKKDALLQFSGVKLTYNPRRLFFDRVTEASVLEADGAYHPVDKKKLYRVVLNSYTAGMVGYVSRESYGLLKMEPRDAEGRVLAENKAGLIDADAALPGVQELKEWAALASTLRAFPDEDGNGIPDIPERYRRTEGRFAAKPSWNPAKLVLGGNGLTAVVLAVVALLILAVVFVVRRILGRRRARRAARR